MDCWHQQMEKMWHHQMEKRGDEAQPHFWHQKVDNWGDEAQMHCWHHQMETMRDEALGDVINAFGLHLPFSPLLLSIIGLCFISYFLPYVNNAFELHLPFLHSVFLPMRLVSLTWGRGGYISPDWFKIAAYSVLKIAETLIEFSYIRIYQLLEQKLVIFLVMSTMVLGFISHFLLLVNSRCIWAYLPFSPFDDVNNAFGIGPPFLHLVMSTLSMSFIYPFLHLVISTKHLGFITPILHLVMSTMDWGFFNYYLYLVMSTMGLCFISHFFLLVISTMHMGLSSLFSVWWCQQCVWDWSPLFSI